ncbi:hypothetical protein O6H91_05G099500 [Diphasiastrum complanatum]|uniref:Uncharacterized protein n=1 Tax=Diphasiastrum complanatum TaxID=34168 RepID=A0ACC2DRC2_DIPCM|nr:hypothetical protein O6H91_05G099500 [Diphasiastrum complanatum]
MAFAQLLSSQLQLHPPLLLHHPSSSSRTSVASLHPLSGCAFMGGFGSSCSLRSRLLLGQTRNSVRLFAWFKFGKNGLDAEGAGIYGSQGRDDFDRDDVEQYFNYMGMLATEGTYDKMEALLDKGIHPVDILLLLAASEGDKPKIEELIRAGADYRVTDVQGRNALERASSEGIRQLILSGANAVA